MKKESENIVGGFLLVNEEKLERVKFGAVSREGKLSGGIGKNAPEESILAEYDKLGGLIMKNGIKVKTGSFYDFASGAPRKTPQVVFLTNIDSQIVEVTEEEALAIEKAKSKLNNAKSRVKADETEEESEETEEAEEVTEEEVKPKGNKRGGKK